MDRSQPVPRGVHLGYCLLFSACLLTACSAVDPAPFQQFSGGLQNLSQGVEAQAQADREATRRQLIEDLQSGRVTVAELQLDFDAADPTFGFQYFSAEPLDATLARFEAALSGLNGAMVAYSDLLVQLAGDQVVNEAEFDALAQNLTASVQSAVSAFQSDMPPAGQPNIGFFSEAVVTAFRGVIDAKRRRALSRGIEAAQPAVEDLAEELQRAIRFLAVGVKGQYLDQVEGLLLSGDASSAQAILQWNDETEQRLTMLKRLHDSYGALPIAHRNLASAVNRKDQGLAGLLRFTQQTLRLQQLAASALPTSGQE